MEAKKASGQVAPLDVREATADTVKRDRLASLIVAKAALVKRKAALTSLDAHVTGELEALMEEIGVKSVQSDMLVATRYPSHTTSIDRKVLMRRGVPVDVLAEATKRTDFYIVRITDLTPKQEDLEVTDEVAEGYE